MRESVRRRRRREYSAIRDVAGEASRAGRRARTVEWRRPRAPLRDAPRCGTLPAPRRDARRARSRRAPRPATAVAAREASQLDAGEALLVRGANGAGKTTLLRILAGLAHAEHGAVSWRGARGRAACPALRDDVLFVGHVPALRDELSAAENLASLPRSPPSAAPRACERAGRRRSRRAGGAAGARAVAGTAPPRAARAARVDVAAAVDPRRARHGARCRRRALARGARAQHLARGGVAVLSTHAPLDFAPARVEGARAVSDDVPSPAGADPHAVGAALAGRSRATSRIAVRARGELGVELAFYALVASLFPLTLAPDPALLRSSRPACCGSPRCSRRCSRCRDCSPPTSPAARWPRSRCRRGRWRRSCPVK